MKWKIQRRVLWSYQNGKNKITKIRSLVDGSQQNEGDRGSISELRQAIEIIH